MKSSFFMKLLIVMTANVMLHIVNLGQSFTINSLCDTAGYSWNYTEVIDWTTRTRRITTNGCPNHFSVCQKAICGDNATFAAAHKSTYDLPLYPQFATALTDAVCMGGTLAIALNGVSIQGMNTGFRACVVPRDLGWHGGGQSYCALHGQTDGILDCGNAVLAGAAEFDKCGGHADIDGLYHYNVAPVCLILQLEEQRMRDQSSTSPLSTANGPIRYGAPNNLNNIIATSTRPHSPQIGWALDGFPVYGPHGPYGIEMRPCSSSNSTAPYCLDVCNGLRAQLLDVDAFLYRYYSAGPLADGECNTQISDGPECAKFEAKCCISRLPPLSARPYTIGCFVGCPVGATNCVYSGERGTTSVYVPRIPQGPRGVFLGSENSAVGNNVTAAITDNQVVGESASSGNFSSGGIPLRKSATLQEQLLLQRSSPYLAKSLAIVRLPDTHGGGLGALSFAGDMTLLPSSSQDNYVYGIDLAAEPGSGGSFGSLDRLYFSTPAGVFSMSTEIVSGRKQKLHAVVIGITVVTLIGFNFVTSLPSLQVTVKGIPCRGVSIVDVSLQEVMESYLIDSEIGGFAEKLARTPLSKLVCTVSGVSSLVPLDARDVLLVANAGSCSGVDPNPLEVLVGGTGRPSVANVSFAMTSFYPYAVAVPKLISTNESSCEQVHSTESSTPSNFVYWSNLASSTIHRTALGGTYTLTETVVTEVPSVYGMAALRRIECRPAYCGNVSQITAESDAPSASVIDLVLFTSSLSAEGYLRCVALDSNVRSPVSTRAKTSSSVVLAGLREPRGLAVDVASKIVVISLLDGDVYSIDLDVLLPSADEVYEEISTVPTITQLLTMQGQSLPRARKLLSASTRSRLDGVAVVQPVGPYPWTEERIFVMDWNTQSMWLLRDTGGWRRLVLGRAGAITEVAVPRGVVGRLTAKGDVVVFVTDLLGRIWHIALSRSASGVVDDVPLQLDLLLDSSDFAAADFIRGALSAAASTGPPVFLEIPF